MKILIIIIICTISIGNESTYLDPGNMLNNANTVALGGIGEFNNDASIIYNNSSMLIKQKNNIDRKSTRLNSHH